MYRLKQVLQSLKTGITEVAEVPAPAVRRGYVLIRSASTLVSAGTERMLVEFGKASLLDKARQQPDKVKLVIDKARTDGIIPTVQSVRNKLDQPLALGYCNAGVVIETGAETPGFAVGDRVVSNGKHAELVAVPSNLCARIPDGLSFEEAAFTVVGAIALQGIRLAAPTLGECVVVTGLGLIGLMTVQLLRAHGCRVLGIDFDENRLKLAREMGADVVDLSGDESPINAAAMFSRSRGVDAVIITASTTSSEPVHEAAMMCRKRGRIVLIGVTGLELSRADFYEKELSFQVSCSYGPGRYDPAYEEKGHDYPVGFVRWTEQRNFEAVLDMMADGRLNVKPLISHRFSIECADQAYDLVTSGTPSLGVLLEYPTREEKSDERLRTSTVVLARAAAPSRAQAGDRGAVVAFIGAGNYSTAVLMPAFQAARARLKTVVSNAGVSGLHAARKFGFEQTTTDHDSVLADDEVNVVVITTRHDSHARLVCDALAAGKHVFVEKPLALTLTEVEQIQHVYAAANADGARRLLMVGFNRRFAPHVIRMHSLLRSVPEPKVFVMTVNAGAIPPEHWTQDHDVGGGRIVGEACHFIDLVRHLAGSRIVDYQAASMGAQPGVAVADDKASLTLRFADGSLATILYLANGHKAFPKERLEVFAAGRILQLDNYRRLSAYGWPGFKGMNLWRQDKGQHACAAAFVQAIRNGPSPIAFDELLEVSRVSIELATKLQ